MPRLVYCSGGLSLRIPTLFDIPKETEIFGIAKEGSSENYMLPLEAKGNGQSIGNSGVELMGRYEIQVLESADHLTYADGGAGAVYGVWAPLAGHVRLDGAEVQHGRVVGLLDVVAPGALRRVTVEVGTRAALDVPWEKLGFNQRRSVYPVARPGDADFKRLNDRLSTLQRRETQGISTLVMEELPGGRPSTIFIKGDFTRPGDPVTPGTPVILPPLKAEKLRLLSSW